MNGGFDRDKLARWYAQRHYKTDQALHEVVYLPTNAPDREIRLLEVNGSLIPACYQAPSPTDELAAQRECPERQWCRDQRVVFLRRREVVRPGAVGALAADQLP